MNFAKELASHASEVMDGKLRVIGLHKDSGVGSPKDSISLELQTKLKRVRDKIDRGPPPPPPPRRNSRRGSSGFIDPKNAIRKKEGGVVMEKRVSVNASMSGLFSPPERKEGGRKINFGKKN